MSITLDLPPDLENKLTSRANERGLSLPDYVLELLGRDAGATEHVKNGAELVAYWQQEGLIGTRTDHRLNLRTACSKAERRSRGQPMLNMRATAWRIDRHSNAKASATLDKAIKIAIREVEQAELGVRVARVESEAANVIAKINAAWNGRDPAAFRVEIPIRRYTRLAAPPTRSMRRPNADREGSHVHRFPPSKYPSTSRVDSSSVSR